MYPVPSRSSLSSNPTKIERWGSVIAHGSALLIGLPLWLWLPLYISLVLCPIVAYMVARSFRRRGLAWGAFQGLQASVMQLMILALIFGGSLLDSSSSVGLTFWTAGVLLFLYSLWGALDTGLGYNFRYIGISSLLERVSEANLKRQEQRRRWLGTWSEKDSRSR